MKTPHPQSEFSGALTRNHWDVPLRVRLLPYVEFSCWLDGELEKLVSRLVQSGRPRSEPPQHRAVKKGFKDFEYGFEFCKPSLS